MRDERFVDLNSVLMTANLLVAGGIALLFTQVKDSPYIDRTTLTLGLVLCAQTQLALWHEKYRRDALVIFIAGVMIIYYALRLCTLTLYPYSLVFDRYPYTPADSNRALVFILIANLALYAGCYCVKSRVNQTVSAAGWRPTSPGRAIFLLLVAIIVGYATIHYRADEESSSLASLLGFLIEPGTVIMMALTYYLLFRNSLSHTFKVAIAGLLAIEMILHTLAGSRSALVVFIESCAMVVLAINGRIRFRRKTLVLTLALAPVIVALLIGSFVISTFNRGQRQAQGMASFSVTEAFTLAKESGVTELALGPALDIWLAPMFARVGFFDFSAEIIAHRREYASVLNPTAYAESIVDNVLTPGFDVYDQPKTGNALQFLYREVGTPSKIALAEMYQSDQLGVYGELYGLFGWYSLPLFFLTTYMLKLAFLGMRSTNPFTFAMKRVIVLYVLFDILNSFGIDWTILEALGLIAALFIYGFFFRATPSAHGAPKSESFGAATGALSS